MPDKRVILVGKTGLDAALRLQSHIEVVRVHTALEAVGEVSIAARESRGSVVVLAPEWERAMVVGGAGVVGGGAGGAFSKGGLTQAPTTGPVGSVHGLPHGQTQGPSNGTLSKFVDGLRLIDPCVSIIGVEEQSSGFHDKAKGTPTPSQANVIPMHVQLDAKIPVYSSTQAVIDAVEMVYRKRHEADFSQTTAEQQALDALPDDLGEGLGDSVLLDLLLKGKEILPCALKLIEHRSSGAVEFVAKGEGAPLPTGSSVERGGIEIGVLRGAKKEVLDAHARWLSKWLKASEQHRQLRTAAFTDALTGAWNRRYFNKHLESSLEIAKTLRRDLLVLVFDVDNFKLYNDQFGHHIGDEMLTEVARLMGSVVRPSDRVCRIGGDEFAVVFFDPQGPRKPGSTNRVSVVEMAERFRAKVASHTFPKLAGLEGAALTISGGMAVYPWDGTTAAELVERADQLARESKREGKNIIRFGDMTLQDSE